MTLLLVLPGVSFAAQEPAPVPGTETPAPLRLVDPPAEAEQGVHPALRVSAEVAGSVLISLIGALVGFEAGLQTGDGWFGEADTGFAIGGALGAGLGAWGAGRLVDGRGYLIGALLGAGGGVLAGALAAMAINNPFKPWGYVGGAMIGSVIGYELSRGKAPKAKSSEPAGASLQPLLGVSASGALVGLGGRF
jgi:hypothetical protein